MAWRLRPGFAWFGCGLQPANCEQSRLAEIGFGSGSSRNGRGFVLVPHAGHGYGRSWASWSQPIQK